MVSKWSVWSESEIYVKTKIVSQGIAQLIDHLSEQYKMRFTLVSIGSDPQLRNFACKIVSATKYPVKLKNTIKVNKSEIVDYDESYIVLHNNADIFPRLIDTTKLLTYRRKLTLSFDISYTDDEMLKDIEQQPREIEGLPHDFYMIVHSPENGSMWLMGNELFFNQSCKSHFHPVNMFDASKRQWQTKKFQNEYREFHGCEIEIGEEDAIAVHNVDQFRVKMLKYLHSIFETFGKKYDIDFEDSPVSDFYFNDPAKTNATIKKAQMEVFM